MQQKTNKTSVSTANGIYNGNAIKDNSRITKCSNNPSKHLC